MAEGKIADARRAFHRQLIERRVLATRNGSVTNADSDNKGSTRCAELMAQRVCAELGVTLSGEGLTGQTQGKVFADLTMAYVETALNSLAQLAKVSWSYVSGGSIYDYAQYAHLREIEKLMKGNEELQIILGADYIVEPDVVVSHDPLEDLDFGEGVLPADGGELARSTFLRRSNTALPILHASVSCKWTLRSDRAQNARTEALNMIRNRKGRVPAITVVTAEPQPTRLASLADGTGDFDRIYHVALYELQEAVSQAVKESPRIRKQQVAMDRMVNGGRLADISDLPFDVVR